MRWFSVRLFTRSRHMSDNRRHLDFQWRVRSWRSHSKFDNSCATVRFPEPNNRDHIFSNTPTVLSSNGGQLLLLLQLDTQFNHFRPILFSIFNRMWCRNEQDEQICAYRVADSGSRTNFRSIGSGSKYLR